MSFVQDAFAMPTQSVDPSRKPKRLSLLSKRQLRKKVQKTVPNLNQGIFHGPTMT